MRATWTTGVVQGTFPKKLRELATFRTARRREPVALRLTAASESTQAWTNTLVGGVTTE